MIVPEGPEADRRQSLFDRYYSVGRLRSLAEKAIEPSTFGDLWIGLQQTFALFEDGDSNPLGIPPLNGDLFSTIAVKDLQGTHLYNDVLLAAMQRLSLFEDHRVRQRVNYSALDVEELGSVYESLLDFQPAFTEQPEGMSFELRIGSERKSTGSYYTRPELVRELIESALVPVMQDRLAAAKDSDPAKEKEKKQQAILSMSVCDPGLRLRALSAGSSTEAGTRIGEGANRGRRTHTERISPCRARCNCPLRLRRGREPAGCGLVQAGAVAGRSLDGQAAQFSRPPDQAAETASSVSSIWMC